MTDEAAPKQAGGGPDLARFLQDWTEMWREEARAQTNDPAAMAGAMEVWRAVMAYWADAAPSFLAGVSPGMAGAHDLSRIFRSGPAAARPQTADAASVAVDAEVRRLNRRVDELEARIARLETPRRRRS